MGVERNKKSPADTNTRGLGRKYPSDKRTRWDPPGLGIPRRPTLGLLRGWRVALAPEPPPVGTDPEADAGVAEYRKAATAADPAS